MEKNKTKSSIWVVKWTSYVNESDIEKFIDKCVSDVNFKDQTIYLALPFTSLQQLSTKIPQSNFYLGAAQMNSVAEGAFTKNIAASMLTKAGAKFAMVGQSFEKRFFGETIEHTSLKIKSALEAGLTPVFCVGENFGIFEEFDAQKSKETIENQLKTGLADLAPEQIQKIIFLFEAPWIETAIIMPDTNSLIEIYQIYYQILEEILGKNAASTVSVIYAIPHDLPNLHTILDSVQNGGFYFPSQHFFYRSLNFLPSGFVDEKGALKREAAKSLDEVGSNLEAPPKNEIDKSKPVHQADVISEKKDASVSSSKEVNQDQVVEILETKAEEKTPLQETPVEKAQQHVEANKTSTALETTSNEEKAQQPVEADTLSTIPEAPVGEKGQHLVEEDALSTIPETSIEGEVDIDEEPIEESFDDQTEEHQVEETVTEELPDEDEIKKKIHGVSDISGLMEETPEG